MSNICRPLIFSYSTVVFCYQVGDVRLTALQALQGLYENEPFVPLLELFTDRFKVLLCQYYIN